MKTMIRVIVAASTLIVAQSVAFAHDTQTTMPQPTTPFVQYVDVAVSSNFPCDVSVNGNPAAHCERELRYRWEVCREFDATFVAARDGQKQSRTIRLKPGRNPDVNFFWLPPIPQPIVHSTTVPVAMTSNANATTPCCTPFWWWATLFGVIALVGCLVYSYWRIRELKIYQRPRTSGRHQARVIE